MLRTPKANSTETKFERIYGIVEKSEKMNWIVYG